MATVAALAFVAGNSASAQTGPQREGAEPRGTTTPATPDKPAAPKQKAQAPSDRPSPAQAQPAQPGPARQQPAQTPSREKGPGQQPGTAQTPRGPSDTPTQAQPTQPGPAEPGRAQTPGGPGDAKSVQLNTNQRTRIRSVITSQRVEKTTRVSFNINIGVRVPRAEVRLFPVPVAVVQIVPAYSGYLYFYYEEDDVIVIVHPTTLEIVAVIPA